MKRTYTDMIGREVVVDGLPQRIVSLVPSQTELLYDLGLNEEVVGITKFCVHPNEWFRNKKRVGGTKNVHIDIVRSLQPTLIIANKEENTREQVEAMAAEFQVWTSDIRTIADGLDMIGRVGELTGKAAGGAIILQDISRGFAGLTAGGGGIKTAYCIWRNPWMCAGNDTFINDMMARAGLANVLADEPRYPEVGLARLRELGTELVLLSSEPYPFSSKHIAEITEALPAARVMLVDGEMFSWYGSRMRLATAYLQQLVNDINGYTA